MNEENIEQILSKLGSEDVPADVHKIAEQNSEAFTRAVQLLESQESQRMQMVNWLVDSFRKVGVGALATAAVVLLFVFIGKSSESIAWADVAERFRSVPFFSAAIYIKEDAVSEPKQMELWMSRDRRVRLRTGSRVVFGRDGQVTKTFDIQTRQETEADYMAEQLIEKFGSCEKFSLDVVVRTMFRGRLQEVTPLVNSEAVISEDIVVFDLESDISPEWMRIWALRESKLPVRIRMWDPRDGECIDAAFTYSKEQADAFFDPNAFEDVLRGQRDRSKVNIVYAFLRDAGGKQITPEDIFAESGYHLPEVEQAGITPQGAVWVVVGNGRNRRPDGFTFFGFRKLEDDLGREYKRVHATHQTRSDQSVEVFVPLDYPFDERIPSKLVLPCYVEEHDPRKEPELIGTVELTEWQQGQMWPGGTVDENEDSFITQMAWTHCNRRDYDRLERILAIIKGEPEESEQALERERIRLRMLLTPRDFGRAVELGNRLMPLLETEYTRWKGYAPSPHLFTDYIVALAGAGEIEKAKETWTRIKQMEPEIPDNLNRNAKHHIRERIQTNLNNSLELASGLSRTAGLTVEQINLILGIDVRENEELRHLGYWDWAPAHQDPIYDPWRKHLRKLADHYKSHPLPERMELLPLDANEEFKTYTEGIPGIHTHRIQLIVGSLSEYLASWGPAAVGKLILPEELTQVTLRYDLVYARDTGLADRYEFVLDQHGLEVIEVNQPRTVWVAHYDGRKLKPYTEVKALIPYDGKGEFKSGMAIQWGSISMAALLERFTWDQNRDLSGKGTIVIDETGIKSVPDNPADRKSVAVSSESPNWEGEQAKEIARKWFKEQFGVTFTEEIRPMKIYVVRKRL